jgi:hypothetical protein
MGSESDVAAWAKTHGAGFEVAALIEQVRGRRVQIGFTVRLFARMPMDERPQKERWAEALEIRDRLVQILQSLAPAPGGRGRLEIEPFRSAATLDPTRELEPEISVVGTGVPRRRLLRGGQGVGTNEGLRRRPAPHRAGNPGGRRAEPLRTP